MEQIHNNPATSGWRICLRKTGTTLRWRVVRTPTAHGQFAARVAAEIAGVPIDSNGWVKREWVQQYYVEQAPPICSKPKCRPAVYSPLKSVTQ